MCKISGQAFSRKDVCAYLPSLVIKEMQNKITMKVFLFRVGQLKPDMEFFFLKDLPNKTKGTTTTKGNS